MKLFRDEAHRQALVHALAERKLDDMPGELVYQLAYYFLVEYTADQPGADLVEEAAWFDIKPEDF